MEGTQGQSAVDRIPRVAIVGAGDHGRVVTELVHAAGRSVIGFVQPDAVSLANVGDAVDGIPVLGHLEGMVAIGSGVEFVIALGANRVRETVYRRALELGWRPATVVHPTAILLGGATVGPGSQVCAGAVVGVAVRVGEDVIVNTAATLDHDDVIGDHAFIGPGAHLAGRVRVGEGAHVGIGVVVREGCTIGDRAYVAAGAVVVRDVPPGVRVAGIPARPMDADPEQEDA